MKKSTKKKVLLLAALLALTVHHGIDYVYTPQYEIINSSEDGFARYSCGRIFIGNEDYINSISNRFDTDIFVLDQRNCSDPNFKIYSSYLITDKNVRNEILEILCEYELLYPSKWDRTIESMRVEWLAHNVSYFFNYEPKRTIDVDLNNNDEELYDNILLRKILKL